MSAFFDAETACIYENKIYMFGSTINILYCVDIEEGKVEILGNIPGYNLCSSKLVGKLLIYKEKIILLPFNADNVWIYNLHSNNWTEVKLEGNSVHCEKFYQGFLEKNKVHAIGCRYPAIVVIDLDTFKVTYNKKIYNKINQVVSDDGIYFRTEYIREDNKIKMGCCKLNGIFEYNLSSGDADFIECGKKGFCYEGITQLQGSVQLVGRKINASYILDNENLIEHIWPDNLTCHYLAYILKDNLHIYLSSLAGRSFFYNGKYNELEEKAYFCEKVDEKNFIYMNQKGEIIVSREGEIKVINMDVNFDKVTKMLNARLGYADTIKETDAINLNNFIQTICF
ncbi:MAG: hypothetical protein J6C99_10785 [Lachnospiraceae bacterium]|nr:hypothetical protein [Lachnospiraceae bacterium]